MPPKRKYREQVQDSKSTKRVRKSKVSSVKIPNKSKHPKEEIKQPKNIKSSPIAKPKGTDLLDHLLEPGWKSNLKEEFEKDYFLKIENSLKELEKGTGFFPPKEFVFNALNLTPFENVKVVILGQDPYHDDGQAHGLSFSVPKGQSIPPSLKNIYKELATDIKGFEWPDHGCLETWAKQGVLLLNAALTVEPHKANSHGKKTFGWQTFTDTVIRLISERLSGVVFILWGNFAHTKALLIDNKRHCVIKTAHPSPLSFNKFNGCKCFSKTNQALKKFGSNEINWSL